MDSSWLPGRTKQRQRTATRGRVTEAMGRRRVLRSTVVAGTVGAFAGCLNGDSDTEPTESSGDDEPEDDERPPFEIRTIDARGSESGTVSVPEEGIVQVLNFARTQCPTSEGQTENIAEAMSRVSDDRVRFLTINDWTRGPADTDEELAEWWTEDTDGDWLLGIDESGGANEYYDIVRFPTTIVIGGGGDIYHRGTSGTSPTTIIRAVDDALAVESNSESEPNSEGDTDSAEDADGGLESD